MSVGAPINSIVSSMEIPQAELREDLTESQKLVYGYIQQYTEEFGRLTAVEAADDDATRLHIEELKELKQKFAHAQRFFQQDKDYEDYRHDAKLAVEYILHNEMDRHADTELPDEIYNLMMGAIEINPNINYEMR